MIALKYIGSSGNEYNLLSDNLIKTKEANFHKWKWETSGVELKQGFKITAFTKDAAEYEATFYIKGTIAQRRAILDNMHGDFEHDIENMTTGKLVWGDWYINCYAIESSTYPDEERHTVNEVLFYCPDPFWYTEVTKEVDAVDKTPETTTGLDYPHDFPFDYSAEKRGEVDFNYKYHVPVDFELTFMGAAVNPTVSINGHVYQVYTTLSATEYVVINSKTRKITKYTTAGGSNIYDAQNKTSNIFQQISLTNGAKIMWNGESKMSLKLYLKSSEPRWSINVNSN